MILNKQMVELLTKLGVEIKIKRVKIQYRPYEYNIKYKNIELTGYNLGSLLYELNEKLEG